MKFIDEAQIHAIAGKGGKGCKSFRREKYVPLGGPDGGDGGAGGSIILVADHNIQTLLDFHYRPKIEAASGEAGQGARKAGRDGENLKVIVPVGTEVYRLSDDWKPGDPLDDNAKRTLVVDLSKQGAEFVLCKGGRGGRGNDYFKSPINRVPEFAQPGEEGERGRFVLSLKLLADVGLIGFPNAGKSTLLSRISAARPKIADYPFTTLTPNLGVVRTSSGRTFVAADVPGLIQGASQGKGLGVKFLKHIERTKVLVHLIDLSLLEDPIEDSVRKAYQDIRAELDAYSPIILQRPEIVAISKIDVCDPERVAAAKEALDQLGVGPVMTFSSASGDGITQLVERIADSSTLKNPVVLSEEGTDN